MLPLSLPVLVTFGLLATQDVWNDYPLAADHHQH